MSYQKLTKRGKVKKRREAVKAHHLNPLEREFNFNEVNLGYLTQDEVFVEAGRCYACRKPQCMQACPGNFDIRTMLTSLHDGDFQAAADVVNDFYCFPESFNRVCPAFCQEACIAGKRGDPLSILHIKRYLSENFSKPKGHMETQPPTGIKIAIVGSGPAGLTAGHALLKMGHEVTIFEKQEVRGGMLRIGIPEYRLPEKVLDREIDQLEELGLQIKTGVSYGTDVTYEDLKKQGFKAVLISHGAHQPKWMGIEGEDKTGVMHAIDFLRKVALHQQVNIGQKVVVVGGGDVAIDAVRVATRLGAEATLVYRRTREEMPATREEIEETENESIPIEFLRNPTRIIGGDFVEGVELVKMKLGEPDDSGRQRPVPIEGSEYIMQADSVIMAISQEPENVTNTTPEVELSRWNTIVTGEGSYMSAKAGVFAAGDNVSGPKTAIEAIVQGKEAAVEIDEYVRSLKQPSSLPLPFHPFL